MEMEGSKKVALMTIFQVPNYGSLLQTYATQIFLKIIGYDCDVINYKYPNEWHYNTYAKSPNLLHLLLKKALAVIRVRPDDKLRYSIKQFRQKYLNLTQFFNNLQELEDFDWTKYDAVIAGSDQIWNPKFIHGDKAFMLSFVPDNVKKISFASSFAVKEIPTKYRNKFRKYISRLSNVSVRDNNGINIIRHDLELDSEAFVALDPTLLLSRKDWIKALNITYQMRGRYIVVYILSYAFNPYPYIYEVVAEMLRRYKCKAVFMASKYNGEYDLNIESRIDATPKEFVQLISSAECVITTSFHGTAFALNFNRPLVSVVPNNGDDRQSSLLSNLGADKCAIKIGSPVSEINPYYDIESVNKTLNKLRDDNKSWILNALND